MLSVRKTVDFMADHGHLPPRFPDTRDLRTIFPSNRARMFGLSFLSRYLYYRSDTLINGLSALFELGADGSGRWSLQATLDAAPYEVHGYCIGFVFAYSDDTVGHGYVYADETYWQGDRGRLIQTIRGVDPWIAMNWVDAFANGVVFSLSPNSEGQDDATTTLAQKGAFSNVAMLQQAYVEGEFEGVTPVGSTPPPGVGVNFGVGFQLPPEVDQ